MRLRAHHQLPVVVDAGEAAALHAAPRCCCAIRLLVSADLVGHVHWFGYRQQQRDGDELTDS
jgi:hypothetical protein